MMFEAVYIKTYEEGGFKEKVEKAFEELSNCNACPRRCSVNRLENSKKAICRIGRYAIVSSVFPHFGEEDVLRGWRGSGTIFFSSCNLRCIFCQNWDISWKMTGEKVTAKELAAMMLKLQQIGCHNINFVTPEHVVPHIIEALPYAIEAGLRLPLVYNTGGYDSPESLRLMEGVVDIYMPDFKLWERETSKKYLKAEDYPEVARVALKEMHRQVGDLIVDENGVAQRGILLRHLIMPNLLNETKQILKFIADDVSQNTFINLMDQYRPANYASKYPEINRCITSEEYSEALRFAFKVGLRRIAGLRTAFV